MKFKSKIGDGTFIGLVCFTILTLTMYIFWVVTKVWWPAVALTVIMVFIVLPIFFNTAYDIGKEELTIKSGYKKKVLPFDIILSTTDSDTIAPSYALSHDRICVKYLDDEEIKYLYVSPVNHEEFRLRLNDAMSKSLVKTKKPETQEEKEQLKAVEKAKKEIKARDLTRAEERAKRLQERNKIEAERASVERATKDLDKIIREAPSQDYGISKEQERLLQKRKQAEEKLYKKVAKQQVKTPTKTQEKNAVKSTKLDADMDIEPKSENALREAVKLGGQKPKPQNKVKINEHNKANSKQANELERKQIAKKQKEESKKSGNTSKPHKTKKVNVR